MTKIGQAVGVPWPRIIPDNALARRFGDLLGEANQRLAAAAAEVHVSIAGIPLRTK
jgi:adenosylcobinamide kinase / adenosylcobinamide-phosphate guanylyltransferase